MHCGPTQTSFHCGKGPKVTSLAQLVRSTLKSVLKALKSLLYVGEMDVLKMERI